MAQTNLFIAGEGFKNIETLKIPVGQYDEATDTWSSTGNIVTFLNTSDASDEAQQYLAMNMIAYGKNGQIEGDMPEISGNEVPVSYFSGSSPIDGQLEIFVSPSMTKPFYVEKPGQYPYNFLTLTDANFQAKYIEEGRTIFGRTGTLIKPKIYYIDESGTEVSEADSIGILKIE